LIEKKLTAEDAEDAEKKIERNLCALRALRGEFALFSGDSEMSFLLAVIVGGFGFERRNVRPQRNCSG
jgi:hypothetical protein